MKTATTLMRACTHLALLGILATACGTGEEDEGGEEVASTGNTQVTTQALEVWDRKDQTEHDYDVVLEAMEQGIPAENVPIDTRARVYNGLTELENNSNYGVDISGPQYDELTGVREYLEGADDADQYGDALHLLVEAGGAVLEYAADKVFTILDAIGLITAIVEAIPNPVEVMSCSLWANQQTQNCFYDVGVEHDDLNSDPAICGVTCCWYAGINWLVDCMDGREVYYDYMSQMTHCVEVDTDLTGGDCAYRSWEWVYGEDQTP